MNRGLPIDPRLTERAFALADECMRDQLQGEGLALDKSLSRWAPVSFAASRRAAKIAEADQPFREAWEWLRDRGLAHAEFEAAGEIVVIELEKFE